MLSRSSEYAIRTLTYLAQRGDGGFRLVREMSKTLGIPAPFLGKVLQPLVSRGLLHSQRGRSGGFRLALPPEDITLFQIVDAHEHLGETRRCMLGQAECNDERPCPLHDYWKRAWGDYMTLLHGTTLASLVRYCDEHEGCGYPVPPAGLLATTRAKVG